MLRHLLDSSPALASRCLNSLAMTTKRFTAYSLRVSASSESKRSKSKVRLLTLLATSTIGDKGVTTRRVGKIFITLRKK
ncbi:hypothetical protein [Vibrio phage Va_PF430-3_p42]|nr:hypothetical protein [Vibrio phage Va_PF430-3_p42]